MSNTPSAIVYTDDLGPNQYGQPVTIAFYPAFHFLRCGHRENVDLAAEGVGLETRAGIISRFARLELGTCGACDQRRVDEAETAEDRRLRDLGIG